MNKKVLIAAVVWFSTTTFLLCIPVKKLPTINWFHIYQLDKVGHVTIFLVLSSLFCKAFFRLTNFLTLFITIAFLCSLYGASMEFVQENYIPNRSFDIWDIAADTIGSFGVFFVRMIYPSFFKSK
jgi:VanZ family protein